MSPPVKIGGLLRSLDIIQPTQSSSTFDERANLVSSGVFVLFWDAEHGLVQSKFWVPLICVMHLFDE